MEKGKEIANYKIVYNCNPMLVTDNHKSNIIYLLDVDEQCFDDLPEAIQFLSDCISPITTIDQLVPELCNCKAFNYILPERNIKVKHAVTNNADEILNSDLDWS